MTTRPQESLLGCWHLLAADPKLEMSEPVELEFKGNGELVYSIDAGTKWQIMRLTFRIDGDVLVTDQSSKPDEQRTQFSFEDDNTLVLDYGGARASFVRGEKRAPAV